MAFPPNQHISVEAGRLLGQWARGDVVETPDKALWDKARLAAREGMDELRAFSGELSSEDQVKLKPIRAELLMTGNQTDRKLASGVVGESGFITEDQALDLESILFERGIEDKAFLEKAKASKIRKIYTADYKQAIRMIEQWK